MNGNDLLYIPAGTTREGPVRENNLINLVGINLFKIRIHRPWLPLMEQLEPTLPSSRSTTKIIVLFPDIWLYNAPLVYMFKIEILCPNLVQKSPLFQIRNDV